MKTFSTLILRTAAALLALTWPGAMASFAQPLAATTNSPAPPAVATPAPWETQLAAMGLKPDPAALARATLLAAVQSVDPQARLITPEAWAQLQEERSGVIAAPGFRLSVSNGLPVVASLVITSPLAPTNLAPGDILLTINGKPVKTTSLPSAQKLLQPGATTNLTLGIVSGHETSTVMIAIAPEQLSAIETAERFPSGIGYIKVNGLFNGAGRDLVSQIRAWSETGRTGIILDLRGAGGTDDESAAQVASLYAPGGQFLFAYRNPRNEEIRTFKAAESRTVDLPLMVLVDRETHGAAETLAAALNHVARPSLLIGEVTAGDFNLREAVQLGDELVLMAVRTLDTADGWRYNGQFGLQPSVVISVAERATHNYEPPDDLLDRRARLPEEERDAALRRRVRGDGTLERALDILTGLKTLHPASGGVSLPAP